MHRWKLTIEYDGTPFSGWQRQESGIPSVQQTIEDAIRTFCQNETTLHVAGRTDAGVHARGQVAHVDLDFGKRTYAPSEIVKGLNACLRPHPVSILQAEIVPPDFHARFGATEKLYTYTIFNRPAPPTMDRHQCWHIFHPLDVDAMRAGAAHLIGKHDFTSFRAADCQANSPVRTLDRLAFECGPCDGCGGMKILMHVQGRSFLHHQVRNIIGTLVLVGKGKWMPEDVRRVLELRDRAQGGPTAPAQGLSLMRVKYSLPDLI